MLVYVISLLFITYYISSRHVRINIISTVNLCSAIVVARYIKRIRDVTRDLRRRRRRTNDGRMCARSTRDSRLSRMIDTRSSEPRVCPPRNRNRSSSPSPSTWVYDLLIIICAPLYCNSIPHIRVFISLMLLMDICVV